MSNESPQNSLNSVSPIPTGSYVLFYPIGWEEGEEPEYGWVRDHSANLDTYKVEFDDVGGLYDWIPAEDILEVVEKADSSPL